MFLPWSTIWLKAAIAGSISPACTLPVAWKQQIWWNTPNTKTLFGVLVSETCWPTLCNNAVFGLHQWNFQATCRHEKHQAGGATSAHFMYICLSWRKIREKLDTAVYKSVDETVFLLVLTSQNVFFKIRVRRGWRRSVSCWTVCLWLSERIIN